ncbi:MAG: DUF3461 family protein [Pseudomonadota bacterium]
MPNENSALFQMGVRNPDQITSYSHVQTSDTMDHLRLVYARPHGSLLPRVRTYDFHRVGRPNVSSHLHDADLIRYEISPILAQAMEELDALLADRKSHQATRQQLLRELADLRSEVDNRIRHLEQLTQALADE